MLNNTEGEKHKYVVQKLNDAITINVNEHDLREFINKYGHLYKSKGYFLSGGDWYKLKRVIIDGIDQLDAKSNKDIRRPTSDIEFDVYRLIPRPINKASVEYKFFYKFCPSPQPRSAVKYQPEKNSSLRAKFRNKIKEKLFWETAAVYVF